MWTQAQIVVVMWIMQAMILFGNRASAGVALTTIFALFAIAVIVCCGIKDDRKGKSR